MKRTRQRDTIFEKLVNGERILLRGPNGESTFKLYGIVNVAECVRLIKNDGVDVRAVYKTAADGTEVFDYYYMPKEQRAAILRNRGSNEQGD